MSDASAMNGVRGKSPTWATQPLFEEYEALRARVELIRAVADTVEVAPIESLRRGVDQVYDFLTREVVPLTSAESSTQYPYVGRVVGDTVATAPMVREGEDIARLTAELASIRMRLGTPDGKARVANPLRRVLYGLYELLHVHLQNEEEVYLPLLDERLPSATTRHLIEAMAAAEGRAAKR